MSCFAQEPERNNFPRLLFNSRCDWLNGKVQNSKYFNHVNQVERQWDRISPCSYVSYVRKYTQLVFTEKFLIMADEEAVLKKKVKISLLI